MSLYGKRKRKESYVIWFFLCLKEKPDGTSEFRTRDLSIPSPTLCRCATLARQWIGASWKEKQRGAVRTSFAFIARPAVIADAAALRLVVQAVTRAVFRADGDRRDLLLLFAVLSPIAFEAVTGLVQANAVSGTVGGQAHRCNGEREKRY